MEILSEIFNDLRKSKPISNGFVVNPLPDIESHKLGISPEGFPIFFIKTDESKTLRQFDYKLEFISVQFRRKCRLFLRNQEIDTNFYTLISLRAESIELQEYFVKIVFAVVKKLPNSATVKELKVEIDQLIKLFSRFSEPPKKTIQGLWAELLVIEQSVDPSYLIVSWHVSPDDKFDFNDGIDKLEVKSTSKSKRIHTFSFEQLHPNVNSNLVIASVHVVKTGAGKSIFDLVQLIGKRIDDGTLLSKVNEVIAATIGQDIEKSFDFFFDYQLAVDSLSFYEGKVIPKIEGQVRKEVSNIYFDSDLTEVPSIKKVLKTSLMFESLIK